MSWVNEDCISFLQHLSIKVIKITGRVPQHVALILDGHRRYAKKSNMTTYDGHYLGYVKLTETLRWCLELGIPEVTVYAFSLENLGRSPEELHGLERISRIIFQRLVDEADKMERWGVRLNFVGRLSLLTDELRGIISRAMVITKHNDKLLVNFACCYTGRDEISRAASALVAAVNNNQLKAEDIDETLVSQTLEIGEPELLIRTSGVARLSDFLVWQVSNTVLYFTDVLWPELTVWNFLAALRHFQKYAPAAVKNTENLTDTKREFLANLETQRWNTIEKYARII